MLWLLFEVCSSKGDFSNTKNGLLTAYSTTGSSSTALVQLTDWLNDRLCAK
jgi:hypothetical protein